MAEEIQGAADTATDEQNVPAGRSDSQTFSQAEVDAIVKRRIDKQNAKHAAEIDALKEQLQEAAAKADKADKERNALVKEREIEGWKAEAATEYGVPSDVLRGSTQDEIKAHAESLKSHFGGYPQYRDSGTAGAAPSADAKSSFSDWMKSNF